MPSVSISGATTLSDAAPAALGTAAAGTSVNASRADHVHALTLASGTFANDSSKTLFNDATYPTLYKVLELVFAVSADTANDQILLRLNNISTGTYGEHYRSATNAYAFTTTATGFNMGNSAVAAGGSPVFGRALIFLNRVAGSGGVSEAGIIADSVDRVNYTNSVSVGTVALAADVSRADLVMAGTGKLQSGYWAVRRIA